MNNKLLSYIISLKFFWTISVEGKTSNENAATKNIYPNTSTPHFFSSSLLQPSRFQNLISLTEQLLKENHRDCVVHVITSTTEYEDLELQLIEMLTKETWPYTTATLDGATYRVERRKR